MSGFLDLVRPRRQRSLVWVELVFGRELDAGDVRAMLVTLLSGSQFGPVVFELASPLTAGGPVVCRIGSTAPGRLAALLDAQLSDVLVVEDVERRLAVSGRAWRVEGNTRRRALTLGDGERVSQRLLGLVASAGAGVVVQLVVGERLRPVAVPTSLQGVRSESWPVALMQATGSGVQLVDSELKQALKLKQSMVGARVSLRLLLPDLDGDGSFDPSLPSRFAGAVRSVESPGLRLRLRRASWSKSAAGVLGRRPLALNVDEIVTILGWPYGERNYPGLDRSGPRPLVPSAVCDRGRVVGELVAPGRDGLVRISPMDSRRHTHVVGPSGVGKSTMLLGMALQDVKAGRGLVMVEPKGDLVDSLLARMPSEALDRVVVLDPARRDHVVGLNPLASVRGENAELAVDGMQHLFQGLFAGSLGPRSSDILHSCLLTLTGSQYPSICYIPRLLADEAFRRHVLASCSYGGVQLRSFWEWYEDLTFPQQREVTAPINNKLRVLLLRSPVRAMLGNLEPSLDLRSVFTKRQIVLVPLRTGLVGRETASLIAALVISQLWQAALAQSAVAEGRRPTVSAYLDEFQEYVRLATSTDLADVFVQARGLGLAVHVAHQHLAQLDSQMQAVVLANAQNRIRFRLSDADAATLARHEPVLTSEDLLALPAYQAYADVLVDGERSGPGLIQTFPAPDLVRGIDSVSQQLARMWGVDPNVIDAQLEAPVPDSEDASGRKNPGSVGARPRRAS